MRKTLLMVAACSALGLTLQTEARGFRGYQPLGGESYGELAAQTPVNQVSRSTASAALAKVIARWNTPEMQKTLSDRYFDPNKFSDTVTENLPRDAILRIQSIRGVQTLSEQQTMDPNTGELRNTRIVSVTAQTQLEFNSPTLGFVRRPGVNEFILEISD